MPLYTFYIEGLGREEKQRAETPKEARLYLWNNVLTDDEKNAVKCFDLVEEEE